MTAIYNLQRRNSLFAEMQFEQWDDFAPPVDMITSDHHYTRGRQVSLESSDHWNEDDDDSDLEAATARNRNDDNVVKIHWHVQEGDSSVRDSDDVLDDFTSNGDIILGVSVPDDNRMHELEKESHNLSKEESTPKRQPKQHANSILHDDADDDLYLEELYYHANPHVDQDVFDNNLEHADSFRKRRADLVASMEQTRKTRRVLHEHMMQRSQLAQVLHDIEASSHNVYMMIMMYTNSNESANAEQSCSSTGNRGNGYMT
ncbi:hypothetical protein MPSEU_000625700 [Mayamaea pseudoterrestris]|nr:hypothetical protein MPSEU_000625700 [Mayamaea pseudoterrestris]